MHFLMPAVFSSHSDFKEWFSNPLSGMIEGSQEYNESIVKRLHQVSVKLQGCISIFIYFLLDICTKSIFLIFKCERFYGLFC